MKDIDTNHFEIAFRRHYASLYRLALHYLQDGEAAKDLLGDAFLTAWNKRDEIDLSKVDNYLYVCVRNKCLTSLKQHHPHLADAASLEGLADMTIDEWKTRERRITEVEEIIKTLPPKSRHVLEQCYYHRQTYKQVADEMGISPSGVKKHITKSLALLRAHFNIIKGK